MSLEQFEWFGDKQPSLVCPPNLQSFQCKIQKKKRERFEEAPRRTRSEPWSPIWVCTSPWFVVGLRRNCNTKHQEQKSDETGSVEGWMEMQRQQAASTDHRMLCTKSSKRAPFRIKKKKIFLCLCGWRLLKGGGGKANERLKRGNEITTWEWQKVKVK